MGEPIDLESPRGPAPSAARLIHGCPTCARLSAEASDPRWDGFLRATPLGQFQQSSLWAQAKQSDTWKCLRVVLDQENRIVGGFQILWRRSRFGRIGYISKGPVLPGEHSDTLAFALDVLGDTVQSLQLRALVVQPPDLSRELAPTLARRGFAPNHLTQVISASCWVPLAGRSNQFERQISRSRLLQVRQAVRRGVTIWEGKDADAPRFFELMASTCARQGVHPNPSSSQALRRLAGLFQATGECRLSFADCEGETVACLLDLKFGDRVTTWKKGWNGTRADRHPNALLAYESLRWAHGRGCSFLDFAGMDRHFAECLLARRPLTEAQKKDRDGFNLSFGAEPRLLPRALIWWRHPLLRLIYGAAMASPRLANPVRRILRRLV